MPKFVYISACFERSFDDGKMGFGGGRNFVLGGEGFWRVFHSSAFTARCWMADHYAIFSQRIFGANYLVAFVFPSTAMRRSERIMLVFNLF